MAFRIGRKHAAHSYPQSLSAAGGSPKQVFHFSTLLAPASNENAFIADGGAVPEVNAFKYPAVESTSKAKLVVNLKANTTAVAHFSVALSKDGGATLLGTLTWTAGENSSKNSAVFAFPLTETTGFFDVVVVSSANEAATADITATVELIQ